MAKDTVIVTGANGFLGAHVVSSMLRAGYIVRATVRSSAASNELNTRFATEAAEGRLALYVVSDLSKRDEVGPVFDGARHLIHTASPVPSRDMVDPVATILETSLASLRTLLDLAAVHKLDRVVLTTSLSSHLPASLKEEINEHTWNSATEEIARAQTKPFDVYMSSKTVVEREAWKLAESLHLSLSTIAPVYIAGPVVGDGVDPVRSSNVELEKALSNPEKSRIPGWVDVRDVADAHVAALEREQAKGRRILAASEIKQGLRIDASLFKELLGLEYRPWKQTLEDFRAQVQRLKDQEA